MRNIYFDKSRNQYYVRIVKNKVMYASPRFNTENEAILWRNRKLKEI